jgi:hypothetical protein
LERRRKRWRALDVEKRKERDGWRGKERNGWTGKEEEEMERNKLKG